MSEIHEKAILVRQSVKGADFGSTKQDKAAGALVAAEYGAADGEKAGRYTKRLVAKEFTAKVGEIARNAYAAHRKLTLPWNDAGERILLNSVYFQYMEEQRGYQAAYQAAAKEFHRSWDDAIEDARRRLGRLFKESEFKDASRVFALHPDTGEYLRFRIVIETSPVAMGSDFRVALNDKEVKQIRADFERRTQEALTAAAEDVWARLAEPIEHLRDRLEAYEEADQKRLYESWVDNVKAVADLLPKLNIAGDPRLDALCTKANQLLCRWNADQLKVSHATRKLVRTCADDILAEMAGYTGGSVNLDKAA